MMPAASPVGQVRRTLLSTWKLEADQAGEVSFPFGGGFGCGGAMKISQGQKFSLQTQHKITAKLGGGMPGTGIAAGIDSELSETLVHEISANYEWSYQSRPCEYCAPRVHFPSARIRILSRSLLHLSLFVSRKTEFIPGESYEIRARCRHAPERCENCGDTLAAPGLGSISTITGAGGATHLERVILAERTPTPDGVANILRALLDVPVGEEVPEQLYLLDQSGRHRSVSYRGGQYLLYSIDDIDRAIGAVRLQRGDNRLFLITGESTKPGSQLPRLELVDGMSETLGTGKIEGDITQTGFRLIAVNLAGDIQPRGEKPLRLRLTAQETTDERPAIVDEWPAIVLEGPSPQPSKERGYRGVAVQSARRASKATS